MAQIFSPLPGTFYTKPSPEALPYKNSGDPVVVGDIVGLIEVMKTFIEIKSEVPGTFSGYVAADGSPVTAGQVLAELAA
ncbi:acetyl-CoA carboxylase [Pseudohalocynthiibacter aestuariivivens]|uniref:Biotin carboxyl carrier protein of acetyl-CoA carboxylase n=1 Tax=Pseudohalocynthiibacter aestuariivivens TaxID=1591409 RepID=A0ABV5J9P3_9RHOB|nr:acetyl-CoA carboxylase [Pseudohalocynthiibacter aestuariivivens]MBS9718923.1 biotin carboxyl carrier domain-containing protein [Pseudohalocynthiibacter aestuariivivens]